MDAVIIATPVKAGRHIYSKKTAGLDAEGCRCVIHPTDSAPRNPSQALSHQRKEQVRSPNLRDIKITTDSRSGDRAGPPRQSTI